MSCAALLCIGHMQKSCCFFGYDSRLLASSDSLQQCCCSMLHCYAQALHGKATLLFSAMVLSLWQIRIHCTIATIMCFFLFQPWFFCARSTFIAIFLCCATVHGCCVKKQHCSICHGSRFCAIHCTVLHCYAQVLCGKAALLFQPGSRLVPNLPLLQLFSAAMGSKYDSVAQTLLHNAVPQLIGGMRQNCSAVLFVGVILVVRVANQAYSSIAGVLCCTKMHKCYVEKLQNCVAFLELCFFSVQKIHLHSITVAFRCSILYISLVGKPLLQYCTVPQCITVIWQHL